MEDIKERETIYTRIGTEPISVRDLVVSLCKEIEDLKRSIDHLDKQLITALQNK